MNNPVLLQSFAKAYEAYTAQGVLQSHGIAAEVVAQDSDGGFSNVTSSKGNYRLLVEAGTEVQAREILATPVIEEAQEPVLADTDASEPVGRPPNFRLWVIIAVSLALFCAVFGVNNPFDFGWKIMRWRWTLPPQRLWKCDKSKRDGILYFSCKTYFQTGELRMLDEFKGEDRIRHGRLETYCRNGQLREHWQYVDGFSIGDARGFYCDGKMAWEEKNAGADQQIFYSYYPTGELWSKSYFREDKLNGPCVLYSKDQKVLEELLAVDGILYGTDGKLMNGTVDHYYTNGQLMGRVGYKDGRYHGNQYWFRESGDLLERARYYEGRLHGDVVEYFPDGYVELIRIFRDDVMVHEREYDEAGREIFNADYYE